MILLYIAYINKWDHQLEGLGLIIIKKKLNNYFIYS